MQGYARPVVFVAVFLGFVVVLTTAFHEVPSVWHAVVLRPVSVVSYGILSALLPTISLSAGVQFYDLLLPEVTLRVTYGCTGIFALFILVSAVAAFPTTIRSKIRGLAWIVPVFYVYSVLRIVIMGMVGASAPGYLDAVHSYLMEIVNVGFLIGVYATWIEQSGGFFVARVAR